METLQQYRHVIDKKTKEVFIESFKFVIKNQKLTKLGFIGIIDNDKQFVHDIDVIVFPSKDAKIGEAFVELSKIYTSLERELKRYNKRFYISTAPKKIFQEMIYYLSSLEEGGTGLIPVHSLFFTNHKSFKRLNPIHFQREVKKNLITLYGDFKIINELPILSEKVLEIYYMIIEFEMMNRIKTFPRHLIRSSAESLFSWIQKKDEILTKFEIKVKKNLHDIDSIDKELFRLLKELDKHVYT